MPGADLGVPWIQDAVGKRLVGRRGATLGAEEEQHGEQREGVLHLAVDTHVLGRPQVPVTTVPVTGATLPYPESHCMAAADSDTTSLSVTVAAAHRN
jgi:hypothetical protein